jgi:hypothetical protein
VNHTMRKQWVREALNDIWLNPKSWEQRAWHCGTASCLAGHIALVAGWRWELPDGTDDMMVSPSGERECASIVAASIIWNISLEEARTRYADRRSLPAEFMAANTLDVIERLLVERELLEEDVLFDGAA